AMLDKGTQQRDKFAIAQELESVGASLSFSVSGQTLDIAGKCLRRDVPRLLALLAEQLRTPALSAEELEKLKPQLIGNQQRALESTDFQAAQAFSRAVYPPGHPNRDV